MPRPILETLREIRKGGFLDEAALKLQELVNAVTTTGKGGKLTLSISVVPAGRGSVKTVVVQDAIAVNLPQPDREVTIFFPTNDGDLSRSDPAQMPLALRTVDTSTGEIKPFPAEHHTA